MALNAAAATTNNRARRYSADAVRIIQREVRGDATGAFDDQTATRIFDWQGGSGRLGRLTPDGEMGPASLGSMIGELTRAGNTADAVLLSQFPHILPTGVAPPPGAQVDPVVEFKAISLLPTTLKTDGGAGWTMSGRFQVRLLLNPNLNPERFEYRQFIRGTASAQRGAFQTGVPPSLATWTATGPVVDAASSFNTPGGLQQSFAEDGTTQHGVILHYGRRSAAPIHQAQIGWEDFYLPTQATGNEYHSMDNPAVSGTPRIVGLRARLSLDFSGRVIDTTDGRIVRSLQWAIRGDDIMTV
jgi:hypothetical protein